jgi:predicted Zn-dependent protease with MMP-like domain
MDRDEFEALVADELNRLPEIFLRRLGELQIVIEDAPSGELLRSLGLDPRRDTLFGLYEGVPLPERSLGDNLPLPDRISIFYKPMLRECRTRRRLQREVRITLIHEIAHFLGMDDDTIDQLGYS